MRYGFYCCFTRQRRANKYDVLCDLASIVVSPARGRANKYEALCDTVSIVVSPAKGGLISGNRFDIGGYYCFTRQRRADKYDVLCDLVSIVVSPAGGGLPPTIL
jgi:hypothetical protein